MTDIMTMTDITTMTDTMTSTMTLPITITPPTDSANQINALATALNRANALIAAQGEALTKLTARLNAAEQEIERLAEEYEEREYDDTGLLRTVTTCREEVDAMNARIRQCEDDCRATRLRCG